MCGFAVNDRIPLPEYTLVGEICCDTAKETPQVVKS